MTPWLALAALLWAGCSAEAPTVVAVGDLSCDPSDPDFANGKGQNDRCAMAATANLVDGLSPDALLMLGDLQYSTGAPDAFVRSFDKAWGRHKAKMKPAPGNHEYGTPLAKGYFDYFGDLAGPNSRGWYAFDLGGWRIYSLNSNCAQLGGCGLGSAQYTWLAKELTEHPRRCALAYFHHPRFSSGLHGDATSVQPLWALLHQSGVELVLTGHDHTYERFAPMSAQGELDADRGIREFVVGTGGVSHYAKVRDHLGSEVFDGSTYGVLELTLRTTGYDWRFVPVPGGALLDSGKAECH